MNVEEPQLQPPTSRNAKPVRENKNPFANFHKSGLMNMVKTELPATSAFKNTEKKEFRQHQHAFLKQFFPMKQTSTASPPKIDHCTFLDFGSLKESQNMSNYSDQRTANECEARANECLQENIEVIEIQQNDTDLPERLESLFKEFSQELEIEFPVEKPVVEIGSRRSLVIQDVQSIIEERVNEESDYSISKKVSRINSIYKDNRSLPNGLNDNDFLDDKVPVINIIEVQNFDAESHINNASRSSMNLQANFKDGITEENSIESQSFNKAKELLPIDNKLTIGSPRTEEMDTERQAETNKNVFEAFSKSENITWKATVDKNSTPEITRMFIENLIDEIESSYYTSLRSELAEFLLNPVDDAKAGQEEERFSTLCAESKVEAELIDLSKLAQTVEVIEPCPQHGERIVISEQLNIVESTQCEELQKLETAQKVSTETIKQTATAEQLQVKDSKVTLDSQKIEELTEQQTQSHLGHTKQNKLDKSTQKKDANTVEPRKEKSRQQNRRKDDQRNRHSVKDTFNSEYMLKEETIDIKQSVSTIVATDVTKVQINTATEQHKSVVGAVTKKTKKRKSHKRSKVDEEEAPREENAKREVKESAEEKFKIDIKSGDVTQELDDKLLNAFEETLLKSPSKVTNPSPASIEKYPDVTINTVVISRKNMTMLPIIPLPDISEGAIEEPEQPKPTFILPSFHQSSSKGKNGKKKKYKHKNQVDQAVLPLAQIEEKDESVLNSVYTSVQQVTLAENQVKQAIIEIKEEVSQTAETIKEEVKVTPVSSKKNKKVKQPTAVIQEEPKPVKKVKKEAPLKAESAKPLVKPEPSKRSNMIIQFYQNQITPKITKTCLYEFGLLFCIFLLGFLIYEIRHY